VDAPIPIWENVMELITQKKKMGVVGKDKNMAVVPVVNLISNSS
jgi:hypothetical protein